MSYSGLGCQEIWGMFTNFQIITHIPLMNLQYPANAYTFFSLVFDISNYNLLPLNQIYTIMFPLPANYTVISSDSAVINYNFNQFGYDKSFLDNSNSTPLYILLLILSITFSLFLQIYATDFKM